MTDENAGRGLPSGVQLLWGLREAGRRGPKPSLTRDEIVTAAVELADAEGLPAVSMARVARQVGASTMALYRYVASKEELLLLMSDAGAGEPPDLPSPPSSWREGLTQWGWALRRVWFERPWLLQVPVTGPPAGPNNLAWLDTGLRALAGTDVPPAERIAMVQLVSTYARGDAHLSLDLAAASVTDPENFALDYGDAAFVRLLEGDRYAELRAVVTAPFPGAPPEPAPAPPPGEHVPAEPVVEDEHFAFGMEVLLDGLAPRIEGRGRDGA